MSPFDQFLKAARFEHVEHVPVAAAMTDFYLGEITPRLKGLSEPDRQLKMALHAVELFPEQSMTFLLNPAVSIFPSMFASLREAAGQGPVLIEHIKRAAIPDPANDKTNLARLDNIRYYHNIIHADIQRDYGFCGGVIRFENPFDELTSFIGSTEWFTKIAAEPEFVAAAMELFTEASIAGAKWLATQIGDPRFVILAEDFPGYINRESFKRFVLPYHKRIFETFPDAVKLLHNDSNTTHLLDLLPGCGMDVFHFGYEVDVAAAKSAMAGRVALMGNLSPMNVLARASMEEVVSDCERILKAGAPGGGFIFATGGEVNPGTMPERVNYMNEAAVRFGKY